MSLSLRIVAVHVKLGVVSLIIYALLEGRKGGPERRRENHPEGSKMVSFCPHGWGVALSHSDHQKSLSSIFLFTKHHTRDVIVLQRLINGS